VGCRCQDTGPVDLSEGVDRLEAQDRLPRRGTWTKPDRVPAQGAHGGRRDSICPSTRHGYAVRKRSSVVRRRAL